jgi:hypothetical protein
MSEFKAMGDVLDATRMNERSSDLQQRQHAGLPQPMIITVPGSRGQPPLYLNPAEAAANGLRHATNPYTGARTPQFGLWQHGEDWVYPPWHHPEDLDGSRYRRELGELRQQHRDWLKRQDGRPAAAVRRRFEDD